MKKRPTPTEVRQREEREREKKEPIRRGRKDWKGTPADNAERRRGEGRGLDEPEKAVPPDELK
jgi:hypothetical protein